MITDTVNILKLWETLAHELDNIYDVHWVCASVTTEVAKFTGQQAMVALLEPHGRYYDVWISNAGEQLEQARWEQSKVNFKQLLNDQEAQIVDKYTQSASVLIKNDLWALARERILLSCFPSKPKQIDSGLSGVICIFDPAEDGPLTLENIQPLAAYLSTYLERAELRRQRDRQNIEFGIISDVSQSLSSTLKLEEIFAQVAENIRRILDVESLSLALINPITNKIVFIPELMGSLFVDIPPIELDHGEGIAGWVALHGEPVIVNDAYADKRFFAASDKASGFQTRTILCVPLKSNQRVIGIMEAINKQNGEFTNHDKELLDAISGPLTTAIINAQLHQDVVSEKRRIETIFQSMSEGMITINAEGYITAVNDSMLTLLRRSDRPKIMGQKLSEVVLLKEGNFNEFMDEVIAKRHLEEYPQLACEIRTQERTFVPVLSSGAATEDEEGEVTEIILAFSDLRQIREVERMRDDFFHNVVHELRTPLATILMYARLLLNGRAKNDEEKTARFLGVIEQESDRLQTMVRQMLQLAKLEAKEIQRSSERVKLNSVLDEMLPPLADRATEKGLTFIQRVKSDLPDIIADRDTIYMIFKNLIENAIKFTLSGAVEVNAFINEQNLIEVMVRDEGIGIPETSMPNLFKRFYRTQTAVERGIAGTGIGLYMVKEGIEKHKGTLTVNSKEGQGTTFVVQLPIANV